MANNIAKKISDSIPESVSKHIPNVSIPEFNLPKFTAPEINVPKVTIPEEARRPFYATVGAAEVAVERVRGAVATMQVRAADTQKNLSGKATDKLNDTAATASKAASSAYTEFTRRGEATLGRIWPDAVAKAEEAPAKVAKPKATTKAAPKKRTAPKATAPKTAPKATAPKTAPKATAPKTAPKATAPKVAATVAAPKVAEAKTADKPASE